MVNENRFKYFVINKPYGYLSQFTPEGKFKGLGELYNFPKDVYPVGRLDGDSEGLLILTNDTAINQKLLQPKNAHARAYWTQIEGVIKKEQVAKLMEGVDINAKGKIHHVRALSAKILTEPEIWQRVPPIRFRQNIPTPWMEIAISEGKNRQVRKMTAAVNLPTLRLIRFRLGNLTIEHLKGKTVMEMEGDILKELIFNN